MMNRRFTIDWLQLRIAVGLKLTGEKLSVREAAQKSGLGISAISRASNEHEQSAANVLALCKWLGLDPMNLLKDSRESGVSAKAPRGTSSETVKERP